MQIDSDTFYGDQLYGAFHKQKLKNLKKPRRRATGQFIGLIGHAVDGLLYSDPFGCCSFFTILFPWQPDI